MPCDSSKAITHNNQPLVESNKCKYIFWNSLIEEPTQMLSTRGLWFSLVLAFVDQYVNDLIMELQTRFEECNISCLCATPNIAER